MRTVLLFLSTFVFCINIFSQPKNLINIEKEYQKQYAQLLLDTTNVYCHKELRIFNNLSGMTNVGILVSQYVNGIEVYFFLDSAMLIYRNGQIANISAFDNIGTPIFTRWYDRNGDLRYDWRYTYTGTLPYQENKRASKRALECYVRNYKNGVLKNEGLTVGGKKEGLHVTYDKRGNVKSKIVYSKGKAIKQLD